MVPALIASDPIPLAALMARVEAVRVPPAKVTEGDFIVVPDPTARVAPASTVTCEEPTPLALPT